MCAFPASDSNIEMDPGCVKSAFQKLGIPSGQGKSAEIRGADLPPIIHWYHFVKLHRHVQGVAIRDLKAVLTRNLYIAIGRSKKQSGLNYICQKAHNVQSSGGLDHLGGIQTIGDWFVVGFSGGGKSEGRFYKIQGKQCKYHRCLTVYRPDAKAGSVGITNYQTNNGNDRYLLAVFYKNGNGHSIDFYKTDAGVSLGNKSCTFKYYGTWVPRNFPGANRKAQSWHPDIKWRDYINGILLLSDDRGNIYLIGFKKLGLVGRRRDIADLYKVHVGNKDLVHQKLATFHAKCRNGTSFRWGASALVTAIDSMKLFACERNVQGPQKSKHIRMNVFG